MIILDDDEILLKLRDERQRDAGFRLLISKYKVKLYHHIRRMVNDHEDTDDILQNTFVKIFRGIDGFRETSSLYTWIYRIVTNETLTFIKIKNRRATDSLDADDSRDVAGYMHNQRDLSADDINDILVSAIGLLPEKQKLVFNLRYYDEMSYADMAEVTDTSEGALKASYHHAVKKIEEKLRNAV